MKIAPYAVLSAAILGTAGVLVATGSASSSTNLDYQVKRTKQISIAATRRSNAALNYLAPVRTTATDQANNGAQGVTPLSRVTGAGKGWTSAQIADQAVTTAKIADQAVTAAKMANPAYFALVSQAGALERATSGVTVTAAKSGTSTYTVTFPGNVSQCAPVATVQTSSPGAGLDYGAFATVGPGAQNTQWVVTTYTGKYNTGTDAAGTANQGNQAPAAFNLVVQC